MVEPLAHGIDLGDALALERRHKLALRQFDAGGEGVEVVVFAAALGGDAGERQTEVVGDRQQVAGEIGDGVFGDVLAFPFGAAAVILELGDGAREPVGEIGDLGLELGLRIGRRFGLGGLGGPWLRRRLRRGESLAGFRLQVRGPRLGRGSLGRGSLGRGSLGRRCPGRRCPGHGLGLGCALVFTHGFFLFPRNHDIRP